MSSPQTSHIWLSMASYYGVSVELKELNLVVSTFQKIDHIIAYVHYIILHQCYSKSSNIRHTNSQNLNLTRLGLQLSLRNELKPIVKWGMKM